MPLGIGVEKGNGTESMSRVTGGDGVHPGLEYINLIDAHSAQRTCGA